MRPGKKVWYEPSDGVRFAGVIVGAGTISDPPTYRVRLTAAYWAWKDQFVRYGEQPAISACRLTERDEERQVDRCRLDSTLPSVSSSLDNKEET